MALYGQPQELREIEKLASGIRSSRTLTYENIRQITDVKLWGAEQFWQWPTREEFEARLRQYPIDDLWHVKKKERAIVHQLLNIFRHIEPVSVLMRFLYPDHFGILSPPVEKLLEVSPSSSPLEKYLGYVKDLREIKDYCRAKDYCDFSSVAQVDMAIWTLQEVMDASRSGSDWVDEVVPEHKEWLAKYESDVMLREIRVRNLTKSLFGNMELVDVAEALIAQNLKEAPSRKQLRLASQLAGIQFERAVMELALKEMTCHTGTPYSDELTRVYNQRKDKLWGTVNALDLPEDVRRDWRCAVTLRNKAVHDTRPLQLVQARRLLRSMREAARRAAA